MKNCISIILEVIWIFVFNAEGSFKINNNRRKNMKRKKQLLTLMMAFVFVFTCMPAVDLFAKEYNINGSTSTWEIDGTSMSSLSVTTIAVGDTIKDSTIVHPHKLKIGYYQDSAAAAADDPFADAFEPSKFVYLDKDDIHTVLEPKNVDVMVPDEKRFLNWHIEKVSASGGGDSTYIKLIPNFEDIYTVTYDANGGEGTPPTDNNQYLPGDSALLLDGNMLSRPNYRFLGWSTDAAAAGPQLNCIIGTSNITLYAVWEPIPFAAPSLTTPATINIGSTNAEISAVITPGSEGIQAQGFEWKKTGEAYTQVPKFGTNITASLTGLAPNTSYTVRAFAQANSVLYYSDEKTFTTTQASSPGSSGSSSGSSSGGGSTAVTYSITVSETKGGSITPTGTINVSKDADKTFTIKPDAGYKLSKLLVDDSEVKPENENTYTFKGINNNHTLKAIFEKQYKALIKGAASFKIGENKYQANNKEVTMDAVSYIQAPGYIMLPVRYVLEAFGIGEADIVYENETVTVFTAGKIIQLTVGSEYMVVNDEKIQLGAKAVNKDGRIYVPIGEIARELGVTTSWDSKTKTAHFINE